MSTRDQREAFTLIEMVIAMGVGMLVLLAAYTAFRHAAKTLAVVNRMSVENQVLRAGYAYALEEIDFWTLADDPAAGATADQRRLRRTARTAVGDIACYPPRQLGMPFTPVGQTYVDNEFAARQALRTGSMTITQANQYADGYLPPATVQPTMFSLRNSSPLLGTSTEFNDDTSIAAMDEDRGFDPSRPYQADDPRRWYRGSLMDPGYGSRKFGRYGILTNRRKYPVLGYGSDPRDPGFTGERQQAKPGTSPNDLMYTGPYGPYPDQTGTVAYGDYPYGALNGGKYGAGYADGTLATGAGSGGDLISSRTFTWYETQVQYLWEAFGSIGAMEYLPTNHLYAGHGARMAWESRPKQGLGGGSTSGIAIPSPDGLGYINVDEATDNRWYGRTRWDWAAWKEGERRFSDERNSTSNRVNLTSTHSVPFVPLDAWSGGTNAGYPTDTWYDGTQFGDPGNTYPDTQAATVHRLLMQGPQAHVHEVAVAYNASITAPQLLPQRPANWPDLRLSIQRIMVQNRFPTICRMRWGDPVTGQQVELQLTALGTTLRGARQQRHRDLPTWALWHGVSYNLSTGMQTNFPLGQPTKVNDPTLDTPP